MCERTENWQGMNWIRQDKRLAIYLRDGCACVYCGAGVEQGTQLTLDHVKPVLKGGSNESSNLVTCCFRCNSSRGTRPIPAFARAVAEYLGHSVDADEIVKHVYRCTARRLNKHRVEAQRLIERRGSAFNVLQSMTEAA